MSRATRINFRGEREGHADAARQLHSPGDVAVDRRGVDRALVIRCPDGCGEILSVNLDSRSGKAWRLDRRGGLTLYPSVWRDQGCRAHFILWRDHVIWCDRFDPIPWRDEGLTERVRNELGQRPGIFQHYEAVAAVLGEIPWEVFWACGDLVRQGHAEVQAETTFRIKAPSSNGRRKYWWA